MNDLDTYGKIDLMAIESEARRQRALWLRSLFSGKRAR